MALNDEERERIQEEERVRWEARRGLMREAWLQHASEGGHPSAGSGQACWHGYGHGRGRAWRLLFWLPVLGLLAWSLGRAFCHY